MAPFEVYKLSGRILPAVTALVGGGVICGMAGVQSSTRALILIPFLLAIIAAVAKSGSP